MASRDGIEDDHELISDGHRIVHSAWLTNFNRRLPLQYDWSFTCNCCVSPTSWMFRATFLREPNNGGATCSVTFKRTDTIKIKVEVEFKMKAFPPVENVRIRPRSLTEPRMLRKLEVDAIVDGFIPKEVLRQLGDRHILFVITFIIHGCHKERDTSRTAGDPLVVEGSKDQMLSSKL